MNEHQTAAPAALTPVPSAHPRPHARSQVPSHTRARTRNAGRARCRSPPHWRPAPHIAQPASCCCPDRAVGPNSRARSQVPSHTRARTRNAGRARCRSPPHWRPAPHTAQPASCCCPERAVGPNSRARSQVPSHTRARTRNAGRARCRSPPHWRPAPHTAQPASCCCPERAVGPNSRARSQVPSHTRARTRNAGRARCRSPPHWRPAPHTAQPASCCCPERAVGPKEGGHRLIP
ncbi:hypothetical protein HNR71_000620 [Kribbella sandramycini]|uniref:Uncharacterized protein n=1 Tax=Kribbella sandramycini TaxID=60450 RepID=A0A841S6U2_9ACTN|nr:hypothetical protein [Kribbella sandramycini]